MLGYILDGGWMMLPLVLCSVFGAAVLIDRIRAFRAAGSDHDELRKKARALLDQGKSDEAIALCSGHDGPVAATMLEGLYRYRKMVERKKPFTEIALSVSKTMEEYAPKSVQGLEKRLNLLILIGSIAPLLGMTGTVTGMIRSFDVMAKAAGLEAGAVAGGISEALITTAAGLLIAIPCVVAYSVFVRRVEDYTACMEVCVTDMVEVIDELDA
ncbi:MAG: MotA/TolQ/ExbB proton channel family protein [Kiritimatiellaeota bacterium]|nr:MotA/TolQ/ExbB proton channel family protein [Kiritimatiellota bacterium]